MRLLEHESKRILEKYRIALPVGRLVGQGEPLTIDGPVMLKAQIPIGGRGKAGGILEATQAEEARQKVAHLLKSNIRGYIPKAVYMEEKKAVKQEFFMAITYDTVAKAPVAIFSAEGGVDIEELAQRKPTWSARSISRWPRDCRSTGPGRSSPKQAFPENCCSGFLPCWPRYRRYFWTMMPRSLRSIRSG